MSTASKFVTAAVLLCASSVTFYSAKIKTTDKVCTLSDKAGESIPTESGHVYRIYTKDCGTFENKDSILKWKFNSSVVQSRAYDNAGKQVAIRSTGWGWSFASWFPNVTKLTPTPPK